MVLIDMYFIYNRGQLEPRSHLKLRLNSAASSQQPW